MHQFSTKAAELIRQPKVRQYLGEAIDESSYAVDPSFRGVLKQALITIGYPAEDLAGYTEGAELPVHLRKVATSGLPKCHDQMWLITTRAVSGLSRLAIQRASAVRRPVLLVG